MFCLGRLLSTSRVTCAVVMSGVDVWLLLLLLISSAPHQAWYHHCTAGDAPPVIIRHRLWCLFQCLDRVGGALMLAADWSQQSDCAGAGRLLRCGLWPDLLHHSRVCDTGGEAPSGRRGCRQGLCQHLREPRYPGVWQLVMFVMQCLRCNPDKEVEEYLWKDPSTYCDGWSAVGDQPSLPADWRATGVFSFSNATSIQAWTCGVLPLVICPAHYRL